jgi:hypothetical protein
MKFLYFSLITAVLTLVNLSCSHKQTKEDPYYTSHGDWDNVRLPLVKPYEAIVLNGSHDWIVQTTPNVDWFFSAPNTRKLNVIQRVIFLYCTKTLLSGQDAKEAWFVLMPDKHIEKGFATHLAYQDYLNSIGMEHEPKLYPIDQVAMYFGEHDTIDWQHIDE